MSAFHGNWRVSFGSPNPFGDEGSFRISPGDDLTVTFAPDNSTTTATLTGAVNVNDPSAALFDGPVAGKHYRFVAYFNMSLHGSPRLIGAYVNLHGTGGPGDSEGSWIGTGETPEGGLTSAG
jgi:hypothetical protein